MATRVPIKDTPKVVWRLTDVEVTTQTVYDWIRKGKLSYSNRRVFLQAEKVLRKWYTNEQWIERFIKEIDR